jgi:exodeoxyribonuclease-5
VLVRKGVRATTIHSLIYRVVEENGATHFELKPSLGPVDLIIVDEASTVSQKLFDDLMSFHVPVLFVGDPGQLEPIGDNPNLMRDPDVTLETIHRQVQDSPIIRLSFQVRMGKPIPIRRYSDRVEVASRERANEAVFECEQVVCGYNRTRHRVNRALRLHLNYRDLMCVGDRLICLVNNRNFGVFNGLIGTVREINSWAPDVSKVTIETEAGMTLILPVSHVAFGADLPRGAFDANTLSPIRISRDLTYWDYAYAVTAHKAQGSQWGSVCVIEEVASQWSYARWVYTAITRAEEGLILCR